MTHILKPLEVEASNRRPRRGALRDHGAGVREALLRGDACRNQTKLKADQSRTVKPRL